MRLARVCLFLVTTFTAFAVPAFVATDSAEAGPLMDWLRRRRQAYQVPAYGYQGYGAPAPACGTCQTTCQQTCQRVVSDYVPYTAYRTNWQQVPVTYYRPVTNSDPCTGCTVTCMRPCTTYQWQAQRVPYTAYRTVYRTETYRVPVTTTTYAPPMTPAAPGCSTCGIGSTASFAPPGYPNDANGLAASGYQTLPTGGLIPGTVYEGGTGYSGGSYSSGGSSSGVLGSGSTNDPYPAGSGVQVEPTPADMQPSLNGYRGIDQSRSQSILDGEGSTESAQPIPLEPTGHGSDANAGFYREPQSGSQPQAPRMVTPNDRTASAPVRKRWDYQPVQISASHRASRAAKPTRSPTSPQVNNGWRSQSW
jgi:hypothetical protein